MAIVWIGDFRCKSLQCVYESGKKTDADHEYIIEDLGDSAWFCSDAINQLEKLCPVSSHIVIMPGFLDCVNSCIWKTIDIDKVAKAYKTALEKLKNNYVGHLFYFCSVAPVDGDYASSFAKNGLVKAGDLNEKIRSFNKKMKKDCPVTFLDSYKYLDTTSLSTRDGIRYTTETAKALQSFITSQVDLYSLSISNTFMSLSRTQDDDAPQAQDESFKYWSTLNDCMSIPEKSGSGIKIPNCTGYAWGRFYEITGEKPKLPAGYSASSWYDYKSDGYDRGDEPRVGAVICWKGGSDGNGHVAIVEEVSADKTSIRISQSYFRNEYYDPTDTDHFSTRPLYKSQNWSFQEGYYFQGFIYCPQTTAISSNSNVSNGTGGSTGTSNNNLCTENSYGITREQMKPNALYIWQYLGKKGWSKHAVAALLGNMEYESKLSPCIWEDCINGSIIDNATGKHTLNTSVLAGFGGGYGLTQWTPYTKYTDWCTKNNLNFWEIDSQLKKILAEVEANEKSGWVDGEDQWQIREFGYDISFKEFTQSGKDPRWLAGAFVCNYEAPRSVLYEGYEARQATIKIRGDSAEYWLGIISGASSSLITDGNTPSTGGDSTTSGTITTNISTQLRLASLKTDKITSTAAKVSFIANNSTKYTCTLKQGKNTKSTKKKNFKGGTEAISFEGLDPKTKYTVNLEIFGANDTKETKKLSFTTLQDYPGSVVSVKLIPKLTNNFKDAKNSFTLKVTKPKNLGYYEKNKNGYELCLIVNGSILKTKRVNVAKSMTVENFDLKQEFGYTCKTGDTIQIGVRTWVTTGTGKVLYDSDTAKTSKAICLLDKPIMSFLNLKSK